MNFSNKYYLKKLQAAGFHFQFQTIRIKEKNNVRIKQMRIIIFLLRFELKALEIIKEPVNIHE